MPYTTVAGVRLYYERYGEAGPWLTLIHGGLVHSGSWSGQVRALASGCRVLTYDGRGYGRSDRPGCGYTISQFADDLAGLWDEVGIEQGFVLGFSMGGFVAQLAAARWADRVTGLILVSTAAVLTGSGRELFRHRADVVERDGLEQERKMHVPRAFSSEFRNSDPDFVAAYGEEILVSDPRAVAETFRDLSRFDSRSWLQDIRCPTLILAGELDEAMPAGAAEELHRAIAGSELVVLPGVGHTMHVEDPATFNDRVSQFVASRSRVDSEGPK